MFLLYNSIMIPENETYSFEDKIYQLPEVSRDEQLRAADAVRANQQATNQEIRTQTEQLGTDVPSIQGGLIGPESYFTARYQTPQTNAVVSQLRSTAQASALNQALSNLQAQYQDQYQKAYRNYQKRGSSGSGSGSGTGTTDTTTVAGAVEEQANDDTQKVQFTDDDRTIAMAPYVEGLTSETYPDISGNIYIRYSDGTLYKNGTLVKKGSAFREMGSGGGSEGAGGGGGW